MTEAAWAILVGYCVGYACGLFTRWFDRLLGCEETDDD